MSLRGRKDRGLSSSTLSEEHQLWHSIRGHLRTLEKLRMNSEGDLIALEQRRKQYIHSSDAGGNGNGNDSRDSSLSGMGGAEEGEEATVDVKAAYRKLEGDYQQEQKEIARTLEKVEILMGVVRDSTEPPSSFGKRNKKRRADGRSVSPTPDGAMSPTMSAIDLDSGEQRERKRSNTSKSHSSSGAAAAAGSVTATPSGNRRMTSSSSASTNSKDAFNLDSAAGANAKDSSYIDPARARREVLAHQLPLKKGRKVAFRQPSKNKIGPGAANVGSQSSASSSGRPSLSASEAAAAAAAEEDGETWIMATVIECINNDKNRYVVQDEEDPAMPTYNTTLKAVVPLPDHSRTLPPEDYKPGTHVLGLYPDTSCFYRAIVRGGGPGLGGRSTKKAKKPDELLNAFYQLEFEDDEGAIRDVPASLVVERP